MFNRAINVSDHLEKNKVLIIYGPRQVGKTTLVKSFLQKTDLQYQFFTGDQLDFARDFSLCDLSLIKKMLGNSNLLVIDEAQKIENIGTALKLVVDNIQDIYVIVTGSSSFDLANSTTEALTGRKNVVTLYPLSCMELAYHYTAYEIDKALPDYLIYGMYPNILTYQGYQEKQNRIVEIKDSYLIKDILEFHRVKRSQVVIDLLKLLAFQVGSQVSTLELGKQLGLDNKTVATYLELLEKSFILYRLNGFSRNLRKEVRKMSKYYFYDLGIRNALISNFNHLSDRNDVGQLWENFLLMERIKSHAYQKQPVNYYFWRTYDKKEIDLIEERAGTLSGYEFKWNQKHTPAPKEWLSTYENATYSVINRDNYQQFITLDYHA